MFSKIGKIRPKIDQILVNYYFAKIVSISVKLTFYPIVKIIPRITYVLDLNAIIESSPPSSIMKVPLAFISKNTCITQKLSIALLMNPNYKNET